MRQDQDIATRQRRGRAARAGFWLCCVLAVPVAIAAAAFEWISLDERREPRLVCLMYHRFVTAEEFERCRGEERLYALPVERFEQQLAWLRSRGYRTVRMAEALAFARGERALPARSVLLTIDDGYRCALTRAQPLLKKYGCSAVLFATADRGAALFRGPGCEPLSAGELRGLDPQAIEVFAHGETHRPLRDLPDGELRRELADSRSLLEALLGRPVTCMAVPGNWYDDRVLSFARQAGYEAVFTSDPGAIRPRGDVLRLPRWNVAGTTRMSRFAAMLEPGAMARRRFAWAVSHLPDRLMGKAVGGRIGPWLHALVPLASHPARPAMVAVGLLIVAGAWAKRRASGRPSPGSWARYDGAVSRRG